MYVTYGLFTAGGKSDIFLFTSLITTKQYEFAIWYYDELK